MESSLKKIYRVSIVSSIVFLIFGLFLVFQTENVIKTVSIIMGSLLLIIGIVPIVNYFKIRIHNFFSSAGLLYGVFSAVAGLMILFNTKILATIIPILSGVRMIINSVNKIQIAMELLDHCTKSGESYANTFRELGLDKSSFVACDSQEEKENSSRILHAMPDEFIDFLNNDEWNIELENGIANLSTHAKLRLIDRFILQEPGSINKLSSKETIEKIKSILHTIYFEKPTNIIPMKNEKIAVYYKYENRPISAVFTNQGKLVTLMDKYMLVDDSV